MKKFCVRFSPLIFLLIILILAIFVTGTVLSVSQFIESLKEVNFSTYLYGFLIILDAVLISFAISLLFFSRYKIKEDKIVFNLGYIKTVYDVKEIVEINLFLKSNKLVIYFNDEKFTVILLSPKNYDEFARSVREKNKSIIYDEKKENENQQN